MPELASLSITREELRGLLGEPHFTETDSTRTFGGEEDAWAFTLDSGQRVLVVLRAPYRLAVIHADPPQLEPALHALHIRADDARLQRYPAAHETA